MSEKPTEHVTHLKEKWGDNAMLMGWVAIPTSLIFLQAQLKISPITMNVLLNLIAHWWDANEHPFPAQSAIATRIGVTKRTVQRSMTELEELKLIHRTATQRNDPKFKGRNIYDVSPLAARLSSMTPALKADLQKKKTPPLNN